VGVYTPTHTFFSEITPCERVSALKRVGDERLENKRAVTAEKTVALGARVLRLPGPACAPNGLLIRGHKATISDRLLRSPRRSYSTGWAKFPNQPFSTRIFSRLSSTKTPGRVSIMRRLETRYGQDVSILRRINP